MEWIREPGSFRDPSGFVFTLDGVLYRHVNQIFGEHYRDLIDSGLYANLASDGLLIAHDEVDVRLPDAPPACAVLKPSRIPFVSYPYEWCFSQYKAAALLTLELQKRALQHGMTLRDASAYNVQFVGNRPIFIDTLSFGRYEEGRPWSAYRQFCQHFLNSLALMALADPTLGELTRIHLDGVPLDLTSKLLPISSHFRVGLLTHVHLHSRSAISGPQQHIVLTQQPKRRAMGKTAMLGLLDSLARTIENISWSPPPTVWSTYVDYCNYTAAAQESKKTLVATWLELIATESAIDTVWDLGANVGAYSRVASDKARVVVAFDGDRAAVEQHFRDCAARSEARILPLVQDLTNPSSRIGWGHAERRSLADRGPANVALALALVHHLAIGSNVPLRAVAAFLSTICQHLIIEYVPKEDPQVHRMLALREDVFADYTRTHFEAVFLDDFELLQSAPVRDTVRTLYLMRVRRKSS